MKSAAKKAAVVVAMSVAIATALLIPAGTAMAAGPAAASSRTAAPLVHPADVPGCPSGTTDLWTFIQYFGGFYLYEDQYGNTYWIPSYLGPSILTLCP